MADVHPTAAGRAAGAGERTNIYDQQIRSAPRPAGVGRGGDDDFSLGLLVNLGKSAVQRRPVMSGLWMLGLLLAAVGNGFSVSQAQLEAYNETLEHAAHVTDKELNQ